MLMVRAGARLSVTWVRVGMRIEPKPAMSKKLADQVCLEVLIQSILVPTLSTVQSPNVDNRRSGEPEGVPSYACLISVGPGYHVQPLPFDEVVDLIIASMMASLKRPSCTFSPNTKPSTRRAISSLLPSLVELRLKMRPV